MKSSRLAAFTIAWSLAAFPHSLALADDYAWKVLTINVGTTVGGGFDNYARLLSRHLGKYIPGHPEVVVKNRPGAGGMVAFNYLFNLAPKDGSEIASSAPGLMIDRLLYESKSNARFDAIRFSAIGSMNRDFSVFIARSKGQLTLANAMASKAFPVGIAGPGGNPELYGRAINNILGMKLALVAGYPGMAEVFHSLEQGELDGIPGVPWDDLQAQRQAWLETGFVTPIIQYRQQRSPGLRDVPTILEIVPDATGRDVFNVLMEREAISRPFFAPPGVPAERVEILRTAFDKAMQDAALVGEAKAMRMGLDWMRGPEVADIVQQITQPSASATARLRAIFQL